MEKQLTEKQRKELAVIRFIMRNDDLGNISKDPHPFLKAHVYMSPFFNGPSHMDTAVLYLYAQGFEYHEIAEVYLRIENKSKIGEASDDSAAEIKNFLHFAGIESQEEFIKIYREKIYPYLLTAVYMYDLEMELYGEYIEDTKESFNFEMNELATKLSKLIDINMISENCCVGESGIVTITLTYGDFKADSKSARQASGNGNFYEEAKVKALRAMTDKIQKMVADENNQEK